MTPFAPPGQKERHPSFCLSVDSLVISLQKAVIRTACQECALKGTDSLAYLFESDGSLFENCLKHLGILAVGIEPLLNLFGPHIHLEMCLYRSARLLLYILCATVPKLRFGERCVEHGG